MRGMKSATDGGFYPAVVAAAHSLKNVVGWLGGERLWMACQDLELAARTESESGCRQHLAAAQKELPLLEARLASYLKGNVTQRMHRDLDPSALAASIAARETIRL